MDAADRLKLLGRYTTPRFRYGQVVTCEIRGEVRIVGLTDALIPWPIGQRIGARSRSLVIFRGLARAIRRESGVALCHHFGITNQTVSKWRNALGVGPVTAGTHRLKSERAHEPDIAAALASAQAKAQDPDRCRKIAEAMKGKPRPAHVIEAMRQGRTGKPQSEAARAKMSEAQRRRGAWPPAAGESWTDAEDELLRTLPVAEVVKRTGRTLAAVYSRRHELQLPDGRR